MSRRKNINKKLKQLSITQSQLATYALLSINVLNLWIDAKAVIPYKKLLLIADVLNMEPDELMEIV